MIDGSPSRLPIRDVYLTYFNELNYDLILGDVCYKSYLGKVVTLKTSNNLLNI
ncbi:unnamed protein product [Trichobilharzia regenti]|nr:unnamed protein product [Trichobilharzia regenti]